MALQLGALNQALRKAGVDEDLARELNLHRWAFATVIALEIAIFVKLFVP